MMDSWHSAVISQYIVYESRLSVILQMGHDYEDLMERYDSLLRTNKSLVDENKLLRYEREASLSVERLEEAEMRIKELEAERQTSVADRKVNFWVVGKEVMAPLFLWFSPKESLESNKGDSHH